MVAGRFRAVCGNVPVGVVFVHVDVCRSLRYEGCGEVQLRICACFVFACLFVCVCVYVCKRVCVCVCVSAN